MSHGAARHVYLDRVRGLAVLIMIEAHVLDSWTRVSDRAHRGFGYAMMLGGMGAPLFLFLAGVAVALSAESKFRKRGDFSAAWHAVRMRGWQIFGLAFLFRLQSYLLGGAQNAAGLLKVDILNVMGLAIAAAAAAGGVVRTRAARGMLFAALAVGAAMVTPLVRATPLLNWLPDPVEWYFRPVPGRTNFTLFPWSGFVFAGAAAGIAVDASRNPERAARVQMGLAATAVLIAVTAYSASFLPSIYDHSEFWTSSPTFFFVRVGLITLLLPVAFFADRLPWRRTNRRAGPMELLGKASLFVYWVHVELVYGVFSRPLRRSLELDQALAAYAVFTVFMLGMVVLKNRVVAASI